MTWVAQSASWALVVTIGGADVSHLLAGAVEIDAERGAARVLELNLDVKGTVAPDDYTGKPVTLDVIYGDVTERRFTGEVIEPQVSPYSDLVTLVCSDARQARIAGLAHASLASLAGIAPHEAFADDESEAGDYLAAAMAETLDALDIDAEGNFVRRTVVTAATARLVIDGDDLLDDSLRITLARADQVANRLVFEVQSARERYWRAGVTLAWDWGRSFAAYLQRGHTLPNEGMWDAVAYGLGWYVDKVSYTHLPDSGTYYADTGAPVPANVAPGATGTVVFLNAYPELITGASASLETWWTQGVVLDAALTFEVATSIARYGARTIERRARLDADDTATLEWEDAETPAARPQVTFAGTLAGGYQYADSSGAARDNALLEACARRALRVLYDAHAATQVQFALPWHTVAAGGAIERGDTLELDAEGVRARGIVRRIAESFDIASGDATVVVTLALCRGGSAGVTAPAVAFTAPATDPAIPAGATTDPPTTPTATQQAAPMQLGNDSPTQAAYDPDRLGYSGNFGTQYTTVGAGAAGALYPLRLALEAPEIAADLRDGAEPAHAATVAVTLPEDLLEMTL